MDDQAEFVTRLIGFGLSEKEAQLYLHLLKYGPKTPSPLAKSLKTYREDVHRTLTSLIEKGMVRPSLDAPTVYAAVDLNTALESAVKKQESELREMEARKQELQKLSAKQRFRPSDDVATFKILKSVKEVVSAAAPLILSLEKEMVWVSPMPGLAVVSVFGINDITKPLIEKGGSVRGVTDVKYSGIGLVQELLDIGVEVRHFDEYRGVFYAVLDRKHCISAINIDVKRIALNEPLSMLYTDDATYADYLVSTFEMLWEQSMPATQRLSELAAQGPPQV
ncbi:MAG: helix-turn-helix domain-containing protein [Halobacteriota archaeon]